MKAKNGTSVINGGYDLSSALGALKAISGTCPFPYPQGIASQAVLIYETSFGFKARNEEIESLATRVVEIAWTVSSALEASNIQLSEDLVRNVGQLLRTLEEIGNHVKKRSRRTILSKLLNSSGDTSIISSLEEDLERCVHLFSLHTRLANVRLTNSIKEQGDRFSEAISQAYQTQLQLVHSHSSTESSESSNVNCTLPPAPQIFFGRSETLDTLVAQVSGPESSHVAILGPGGIGKTSVALAAAHHPMARLKYRKNIHFISCEGLHDAPSLLGALGKPFSISDKNILPALTHILSRLKDPFLILLDNFETTWEPSANRLDVESILTTLSRNPMLTLLITLRGAERPQGVAWTRPFIPVLPPLDSKSARQTFIAISDTSEDDPDLSELLEALDNVPLAVTLMSNLAQHTSCATLLSQWKAEKTAMLTRGFVDYRLCSVDVSIQVSLASERMMQNPRALSILQILSLLPDGVPSSEISKMVVDPSAIAGGITALRQVALVYEDSLHRLRVLSPIREFIQAHLPLPSIELAAVQNYYFELTRLVDAKGTFEDKEQLSQIQAQISNISCILAAALRSEASSTAAIEATLRLGDFIDYSLNSSELLRLALSAAQRIGARKLEADCICLSYTVFATDIESSKERTETALRIYRDLDNPELKPSIARCVRSLGDCHRRMGEFGKAVELQWEAVDLFSQCQNWEAQGNAMRNIARTLEEAGKISEAKAVVLKSLALAERHNLPLVSADNYTQLGRIYLELCAFPLAADAFRKAADLQLSVVGETWRYTYNLFHLAEMYTMQSRITEAEEFANKAYKVFAKLSREDLIIDTSVLLAHLAVERHNYDEALTRYHVSLRRYVELKWPGAQAWAIICIGNVEGLRGNHSTAWTHLCEGRQLYCSQKRMNTVLEAEVIMMMGKNALQRGDTTAANQLYITAAVIYRQLANQMGVGECLTGLGDVFLYHHEVSEAKACYQAALDLVKYLGLRRHIADCLIGLGDVGLAERDVASAHAYYEHSLRWYERAENLVGQKKCRDKLAILQAGIEADVIRGSDM
ncbi:TPR-like protein [Sistotremastrum suecicum HHB10207 ss-3]|uniref:TPR-like protein n=1 Tax=Sistotremastrum suecicum HHB10207 ss-3 TaxID=1314776 RepID=A0A165ZZX7_9AGAM|nr:TPR-like protein [Sistotremastrum suecicum HHB10207 ss-3]